MTTVTGMIMIKAMVKMMADMTAAMDNLSAIITVTSIPAGCRVSIPQTGPGAEPFPSENGADGPALPGKAGQRRLSVALHTYGNQMQQPAKYPA